MGQADLVEELTLRIQCDPIVSDTPPLNTKSLTIKSGGTAAHDTYHTPQWQVYLTRVVNSRDNLDIQLHSPPYSRLPTNFRSVNVIYHRRHLASIPLNESAFSNWGELKFSFPVEKALNGERLEFDIILSTQYQPSELLKLAPLLCSSTLLPSSSSLSSSKFTKQKSALIRKDHTSYSPPSRVDPTQTMMKMFLRDRQSVDVQFLFETEITPSGRVTALWAHRLVLSRYPTLDALVRGAETCENGCAIGPVMVRMPHSISLAAFSCLLYYLYTGKVQLAMRPEMFTLSQVDLDSAYAMHECAKIDTDSVLVEGQYMIDILPPVEVCCKSLVDWSVEDAESLWPTRGVPCRELHSAAKHFGIADLRDQCLEGMVESIDASNVVEMLFELGGSSAMIRETVLGDHFVNKIMQGIEYISEIVPTTQPALSRAFKAPLSVDPAAAEDGEFVAHRSVLSRYKTLEDLINTIKRTIDTTEFDFNQKDIVIVVIKDEATGQTKDGIHRNPCNADSLCKMKNVTWTEVHFISEYFGMLNECPHRMIESTRSLNMDKLFEIGYNFDKIREAALDYIADNMESMFDGGKDPFKKYCDHKECHTMMLDPM
ncbi:hypothetical protein BGZ96_007904 [Linnemannia gamsii]|uniref:BTB domain-containing protein n=1 Tax=Linnemannia gamsii TaxID=64522 RepID=A0ABQ7KF91_9FUNG|nr:hypothetical protein BGZ96_007904 [Linnemannia gamsii]